MAELFKAEDYARLFIREFLKKNKFTKAYDTFMQEDTRAPPGGTMARSELIKLLGLDNLERNNKKTKTHGTMLDMVCGYLLKVKHSSGGVDLPEDSSPSKNSKNNGLP